MGNEVTVMYAAAVFEVMMQREFTANDMETIKDEFLWVIGQIAKDNEVPIEAAGYAVLAHIGALLQNGVVVKVLNRSLNS